MSIVNNTRIRVLLLPSTSDPFKLSSPVMLCCQECNPCSNHAKDSQHNTCWESWDKCSFKTFKGT